MNYLLRCGRDVSSKLSGVCLSLALVQPLESTLSDQGPLRTSGKPGPETENMILRIWVNNKVLNFGIQVIPAKLDQ